jgi:hypothetical protein
MNPLISGLLASLPQAPPPPAHRDPHLLGHPGRRPGLQAEEAPEPGLPGLLHPGQAPRLLRGGNPPQPPPGAGYLPGRGAGHRKRSLAPLRRRRPGAGMGREDARLPRRRHPGPGSGSRGGTDRRHRRPHRRLPRRHRPGSRLQQLWPTGQGHGARRRQLRPSARPVATGRPAAPHRPSRSLEPGRGRAPGRPLRRPQGRRLHPRMPRRPAPGQHRLG